MSLSNKLVVPGVENLLHQYKEEIAAEFGIKLGAHTSSFDNGSVGGEVTKRLVQHAQQQMATKFSRQQGL